MRVPPDHKRELRQLVVQKGYRHAVALGPFGESSGSDKYTIALYDHSGRVWLQTLQGTAADLRDQIARLAEV